MDGIKNEKSINSGTKSLKFFLQIQRSFALIAAFCWAQSIAIKRQVPFHSGHLSIMAELLGPNAGHYGIRIFD